MEGVLNCVDYRQDRWHHLYIYLRELYELGENGEGGESELLIADVGLIKVFNVSTKMNDVRELM